MKYQHRQNGKVMEILKQDTQKGTMLIQYEDGKSTSITTGTFKRWFKKVEEAVQEVEPEAGDVQEVMKQKKELGIECPAITEVEVVEDTTVPEIEEKAEPVKKEKKSREKKAKKVKEPKQDITEATAKVVKTMETEGFYIKNYNGRKAVIKNSADKSVGSLYLGGSKFTVSLPEKFVPEGYEPSRVRNCPNSHAFDIAYSDLNKLAELLKNIKEEN